MWVALVGVVRHHHQRTRRHNVCFASCANPFFKGQELITLIVVLGDDVRMVIAHTLAYFDVLATIGTEL